MTKAYGGQTTEVVSGIAVLGYGLRVPGADNIDAFWDLIESRRDVVTRAITNIGATAGGRVHAYGQLPHTERFDAAFFGYSPREAADLDPQQRFLLECAVEALEAGAVRLSDLKNEVGVYLSTGLSSYLLNTRDRQSAEDDALPALLGSDGHYAATRIAYKLGLTGPAMAVGSACSSSLLAIHQASQAILAGECDLALAGGMDIEFPQPMSYLYQPGGIMARDGVCRPFDHEASGTVFGSGGGVVLLAHTDLAIKHGWPVRAIIAGSAVNNDGAAKASFTAPRSSRQRDVIKQAMALAGKDAGQIGYIECHGTGTRLGDAAELSALHEVFGSAGLPPLGSVKANIGHLRVGSGVIGFIKAAEILAHGKYPGTTNVSNPVDLAASYDPSILTTRSGDTEDVSVGVSSFGFGGTNVHVILSKAPEQSPACCRQGGTHLLKVSSTGPESCLSTAAAYALALETRQLPSIADVEYTLSKGRDDRAYRYAVVGSDGHELAEALRSPNLNVVEGWAKDTGDLIFALPGQGTSGIPVVAALYNWEPVFTERLNLLWQYIKDPEWASIADIISDPDILGFAASQLLHVATGFALADQLKARGVSANLSCGFSLGEYVAAGISGALTPEDVLQLVRKRSALLQYAPNGDMIVVDVSKEILESQISHYASVSSLSPTRHVLAVNGASLQTLVQQLERANIPHRLLGLGVPYHSDLLSREAEELNDFASEYAIKETHALLLTSTTESELSQRYWGAHLSAPVDFTLATDALGALHAISPVTLLDLSFDGSLTKVFGADVREATVRLFQRSRDIRESYLLGLASLWVQGYAIDTLPPQTNARLIRLPNRQFDRQPYIKSVAPVSESKSTDRALRRAASLEEWVYYPSWQLRRRTPVSSDPTGQRWLTFVPADPVGDQIVAKLTALGIDVVRVKTEFSGEEYLIKDLIAGLGLQERPIARIVHYWCANPRKDVADLASRLAAVEDELSPGFYTLMYTIKQLAAEQGTKPVRLDIFATGLHPLGDDTNNIIPERSLLSGAALVVPQDLPFITTRTVDLTDLPVSALADEIVAELLGPVDDHAVTFGAGARWVRTYERGQLAQSASESMPIRLKERGVYLITGGLGGIGMTIADYLVRTCRARLVLTALEAVPDPYYLEHGVSDLPDDPHLAERVIRLRKLIDLGGEILAVRCDAASIEESARLFDRIDSQFGTLNGVVHAAGVFETQRAFRSLEDTTVEECERRLKPKVIGTLVLAEHLKGRKLDFVIMQSSLSAQLGGLGFYPYTAGNAFMDAFAERHRDENIPWMSVNWDGWIFRERDHDDKRTSVVSPSFASPDFGVVAEIAIRPSEGAEIFSRLMDLHKPQQILISTADFNKRYQQWVSHPIRTRGSKVLDGMTGFSDETEAGVASIWAEVLGVKDITSTSNFFALGGDSLLGVTLAYRLGQAFNVVLSAITMFDNPTVAAMTSEIRNLGGRTGRSL